jgi:hypothetical protein
MAEDGRTAKTETIGSIERKAIKLDGWKEYQDKADAFSKAKEAAQRAKEKMRGELKVKLIQQNKIGQDDEIDFTVDDTRLTVYKVLAKKEGRKRATELVL